MVLAASLGRRVFNHRPAGLLAGLIFSAMPLTGLIAGKGMSDTGVCLFGLLGLWALFLAANKANKAPTWAGLAGLMLGLAAGFKAVGLILLLTGVVMALFELFQVQAEPGAAGPVPGGGIPGRLALVRLLLSPHGPGFLQPGHAPRAAVQIRPGPPPGPGSGTGEEGSPAPARTWFHGRTKNGKENVATPVREPRAVPGPKGWRPVLLRQAQPGAQFLEVQLDPGPPQKGSGAAYPGPGPAAALFPPGLARPGLVPGRRRNPVLPGLFDLRALRPLRAARADPAGPGRGLGLVGAVQPQGRGSGPWPWAYSWRAGFRFCPRPGYGLTHNLPAALGLESREDYLNRANQGEYEVYAWANKNLPPGARVLSIAEHKAYYLDWAVVYGSLWRNPYIDFQSFLSYWELDQRAREFRIGYVLINTRISDNAWDITPAQQEGVRFEFRKWKKRVERWAEKRMEKLICRGDLCLYRLKERWEE